MRSTSALVRGRILIRPSSPWWGSSPPSPTSRSGSVLAIKAGRVERHDIERLPATGEPVPADTPDELRSCFDHLDDVGSVIDLATAAGGAECLLLIPPMSEVVDELAMDQRTLRRKLAPEGTTYRALLDEVRATLAAELLDSGLTVEATTHRLGSETSASTHAHIR